VLHGSTESTGVPMKDSCSSGAYNGVSLVDLAELHSGVGVQSGKYWPTATTTISADTSQRQCRNWWLSDGVQTAMRDALRRPYGS